MLFIETVKSFGDCEIMRNMARITADECLFSASQSCRRKKQPQKRVLNVLMVLVAFVACS